MAPLLLFGSTLVDVATRDVPISQVVQVYPGLCNTKESDCPGGTNLCIATPADPLDPLQTNWTKDSTKTGAVNPIVNATGRDPSTAWRTTAGRCHHSVAALVYSWIHDSQSQL